MRVFAFYLPQFHTTPENDSWWGKGFTDWIAVKKAVPLYEGHKQPKEPLNEWYYDLSDAESLRTQSALLAEFNIDGLCFYHYYFKKGKRMLDKPAEILLANKDIPIQFCFSWANERWVRNWSNVLGDGNSWNDAKWDKSDVDDIDGILVEQAYGDESDWIDHFYYLLPFFKDERYIRINGHPIMMIYKQNDLYCFEDMRICWDDLAKKEGIPTISFYCTNQINNLYEHRIIQEPQDTIFDGSFIDYSSEGPHIIDYDAVWKQILVKAMGREEGVCLGGFVGYDDTPRRGKNGIVIENASPEAFRRYLTLLLKIAEYKHSDFVIINAWNEWGEGMYLEPDSYKGCSYLEAIKTAKHEYQEADLSEIIEYQTSSSSIIMDGTSLMENSCSYEDKLKSIQRYSNLSETYRRWLKAKICGKSIAEYLVCKGYYRVAIYGMAALGRMLATELKGSAVNLKYGIDKRGMNFNIGIPVYKPDEKLEKVDIVIMCLGIPDPVLNRSIKDRLNCRVIDLKDLIREV